MTSKTTTFLVQGLMAALLLAGAASGQAQQAAPGSKSGTTASASPREIQWEELMPKGWDPTQELLAAAGKSSGLVVMDGTPEANERMRKLREIWDNAPVNPEFDGKAIKLPGFVVPLEETKQGLKEFLLVPYFGACVHSPPPPANQIVHVVTTRPVKFATMDTVWVSGTLSIARNDSDMGVSGYRMAATSVSAYESRRR